MSRPVGFKMSQESKEKISKNRKGKSSKWKNYIPMTKEEKYARQRAYQSLPEQREKRRIYDKLRYTRPEVKERTRLRNMRPDVIAKKKEYIKKVRSTSEFREKRRAYKNSPKAKDARRNQLLLKNFGITLERYNEMLSEQNGVCAICLRPERFALNENPHSLAVDHCHVTGKIRGLLCKCCNQALGQLRDNVENLKRAIQYLSR